MMGLQSTSPSTGLAGKLSPLASLGQKSKVLSVSLDQLREELRAQARDKAMLRNAVTAVSLLGCWVDSAGNTVVVQSDASAPQQLTAKLMKPPRKDIDLSLWQTTDGRAWHCGDAVLDPRASSPEQRLSWVFRDGSVSTWTWTAFTLEALSMRGLLLPEDALPHAPSAALGAPAVPSSHFDDGAPQEWVPICMSLHGAF